MGVRIFELIGKNPHVFQITLPPLNVFLPVYVHIVLGGILTADLQCIIKYQEIPMVSHRYPKTAI